MRGSNHAAPRAPRSATRNRRRRAGPLAIAAACSLLAACSEDVNTFIPDPVAGDPRAATITLDQCDCDRCRVALQDPETGRLFYDRIAPPQGQTIFAEDCYRADMIRIVLECGGCTSMGGCTGAATLRLSGSIGGVPATVTLGTATCSTLTGPSVSCAAQETFPIASAILNTSCPM